MNSGLGDETSGAPKGSASKEAGTSKKNKRWCLCLQGLHNSVRYCGSNRNTSTYLLCGYAQPKEY